MGRTQIAFCGSLIDINFNSLAPCGANLVHALDIIYLGYFNSLAPCGANQGTNTGGGERPAFQLTRPVWGEPESVI